MASRPRSLVCDGAAVARHGIGFLSFFRIETWSLRLSFWGPSSSVATCVALHFYYDLDGGAGVFLQSGRASGMGNSALERTLLFGGVKRSFDGSVLLGIIRGVGEALFSVSMDSRRGGGSSFFCLSGGLWTRAYLDISLVLLPATNGTILIGIKVLS